MKKMTKISTAIASLLVAGFANAATPGAYVGLGAGASIIRTPNFFNTNTTLPGVSVSNDRGGLGGRVFGGYNFNNYFGLETALATYANSTNKLSTPIGNASIKDSLNALSLVGKGYLPLGNTGLNAYVLGGIAEVRNEVRAEVNNAGSQTEHTNSLRPTYGIGMNYDLANHVSTNLELSRIQGKGNMKTDNHALPNADMISFNIGYNFG